MQQLLYDRVYPRPKTSSFHILSALHQQYMVVFGCQKDKKTEILKEKDQNKSLVLWC